jgi:NTP pyrophosphatase (non-canonical NTP hydrolase)
VEANDYQQHALRTAATLKPEQRMICAALGLVGEAGEVALTVANQMQGDPVVREVLLFAGYVAKLADRLKKARFHGHNYDLMGMAGELQRAVMNAERLTKLLPVGNFLPFEGTLHQPDPDMYRKELGDVAWYVALGADAINTPLDEVLQTNIDKLRQRYPDGFSTKQSLNRDGE